MKLFHDILIQAHSASFRDGHDIFYVLTLAFCTCFLLFAWRLSLFARRVSTLESFRSWDIGDEQPANGQIWPSPQGSTGPINTAIVWMRLKPI